MKKFILTVNFIPSLTFGMENKDLKNKNNNSPKMPRFNVGWIYILVLVSLVTVYFMGGDSVSGSASRTTSYKQFKIYVEKGFASKIVVNKTVLRIL